MCINILPLHDSWFQQIIYQVRTYLKVKKVNYLSVELAFIHFILISFIANNCYDEIKLLFSCMFFYAGPLCYWCEHKFVVSVKFWNKCNFYNYIFSYNSKCLIIIIIHRSFKKKVGKEKFLLIQVILMIILQAIPKGFLLNTFLKYKKNKCILI